MNAYLFAAGTTSVISFYFNSVNNYSKYGSALVSYPEIGVFKIIVIPLFRSIGHGFFWPYFVPRWYFDSKVNPNRYLIHFTDGINNDKSNVRTPW